MGAGVAGAIKRAGGEAIEREAMLQGPIELGQAVATTGHDLRAHWVIHAAVMGPDQRTNANIIGQGHLQRARLRRALITRAPSPCRRFGTGVGGFPLYQCASIMIAETVRYLHDHPRTPLRHVMFSTYTDDARAAFKHALAGSSRF